jgi:hypothetical protein
VQTVTFDDFNAPPTNSHTSAFTVSNAGSITLTHTTGIRWIEVQAIVANPAGWTVADEALISLVVTPTIGLPFIVDQYMVHGVALAPDQTIVKLNYTYPASPADTISVIYVGQVNQSLTLSLRIIVPK